MAKDRVGAEINEGDFVAYVTAGDRHPVFEFGWILGYHQSKGHVKTDKIKIQRSDPDGTRHTVKAVDVAGHWRPETPDYVKNPYGNFTSATYTRTQQDWDDYYVAQTYRDTGKPSTTMLDISLKNNNNRLLVMKPFV